MRFHRGVPIDDETADSIPAGRTVCLRDPRPIRHQCAEQPPSVRSPLVPRAMTDTGILAIALRVPSAAATHSPAWAGAAVGWGPVACDFRAGRMVIRMDQDNTHSRTSHLSIYVDVLRRGHIDAYQPTNGKAGQPGGPAGRANRGGPAERD